MDEKEKIILNSEISNLRKYTSDLEDISEKYCALPDYGLDINKLIKEFPIDWRECSLPFKRKKRKEFANEFESKSNSLMDSLYKIKSLLRPNISRSNRNEVDNIIKSIEIIEDSIIFQVGLKENNGWDCDRTIKLFKDNSEGFNQIKLSINSIIKRIGSLQFESRNSHTYSNNNMLLKIKDWIIQDVIHQFITIIVILILLWLGFGGIKSI